MGIVNSTNSSIKTAMSHSKTELSSLEKDTLKGLDEGTPEYDRAKAQLLLQKLGEVTSFVSNVLKKKNDIASGTIQNMR